ncbi:MAG TPA: prolyl oligopeptidase family serine peptidase [bacterium]|nr:prolyl oligopeptidase family serine peptidase [bacterium]
MLRNLKIHLPLLLFAIILIAACASASEESIFEKHKKDFEYDKSMPLNAEVEVLEERETYTKYHVFYDSTNGERVPAYLYVPKNLRKYHASLDPELQEAYAKRINELDGPPWPAIFFMHWLQSDKTLADSFAPDWTKYGYAVLAIDGIHKGERKTPGRNILETEIRNTLWNIRQQVVDCMRGVDYLETRDDIDTNRLGYFGISMGSLTGAITTAVDRRYKAVVLADGAGDFSVVFSKADLPEVKEIVDEIKEKGYTLEEAFNILKPVDPVEYVGHISPTPVLLINGKHDEIFPYEAMVSFHEHAKEPKKIKWYNSGHILPVPNVIIQTLNTFKRFIK